MARKRSALVLGVLVWMHAMEGGVVIFLGVRGKQGVSIDLSSFAGFC